ncbi:hypothetical protein ABER02_11085 [Rossellomorea marisflavi]|uniref:hypothetical protein n=1 Tax=Rossellomorea TaxID=2837508 RepID=UPI003518609E
MKRMKYGHLFWQEWEYPVPAPHERKSVMKILAGISFKSVDGIGKKRYTTCNFILLVY